MYYLNKTGYGITQETACITLFCVCVGGVYLSNC